MLTLNRPTRQILSDESRLDKEYKSARWIHHRLLDFEDLHQRLLDAAAEAAAPGIARVGRILTRLARRAKWRERTAVGAWSPDPRPELADRLKKLLESLRKRRNADPRWVAARDWANEKVGEPDPLIRALLDEIQEDIATDPFFATAVALRWRGEEVGEPKKVRRRRAKDPSKMKRRKTETDENWAKRFALFTTDETDEHFKKKQEEARQTRREAYRKGLYKLRRCYWGTWNALLKSVDQARTDVLARRRQGMPAEWSRPQFGDSETLEADEVGFRIDTRDELWWTISMRLGAGEAEWVTVRAKCGNWHEVPDTAKFETAKLTRRQDGCRWSYSLSLTVDGVKKRATNWATSGTVSFDWGHREHGHDSEQEGIRAFVWRGDDGLEGEILIPAECRQALDEIDEFKERLDKTFNSRKEAQGLPDRNRYSYRRRLERVGVRTEEEANWLRWEMKYERRISRRRKRFQNLRRETYINGWTDSTGVRHLGVRELREHYAQFVFESERIHDARKPRSQRGTTIREMQTDDAMVRRKRANRDLTARYEFVSLCERFGAKIVPVSSRNTTRECPAILPNGKKCGHIGENGPELLTACPACGTVRDKDRGAAVTILQRAEEALANDAAE